MQWPNNSRHGMEDEINRLPEARSYSLVGKESRFCLKVNGKSWEHFAQENDTV